MTIPERTAKKSAFPFASQLAVTLAMGLLIGLAVGVSPVSTMGDDSPVTRSQLPRGAYSVGEQGNKLKWLPYRPSKPRDNSRVVPASHVATATTVARAATAQQAETEQGELPSPLQDPFGDRQGRPLPIPPTQTPNGDSLSRPGPEPPLGDGLPEFPPRVPDFPTGGEPLVRPGEEPAGAGLPGSSSVGKGIEGPCPAPDEEDFFTPLNDITIDISPPGKGSMLPRECSLGEPPFEPRTWVPTTFTWKASGLCHKPLYFEDVHLERYGHSSGPYIQPIISGGLFFLTIPALPYKMGLYPPCECMYSLGYYRPGSCAPYLLDPLPISVRAGLAEVGVVTGLVYALP